MLTNHGGTVDADYIGMESDIKPWELNMQPFYSVSISFTVGQRTHVRFWTDA